MELVSDSSTTGWLHWGHGDLWIDDTGIIRVNRGVARAARMVVHWKAAISAREEVEADAAECPGSVVIARTDLRRAKLHKGLTTDRLDLFFDRGRSVFLWRTEAPARAVASRYLAEWLGDDFRARRSPR